MGIDFPVFIGFRIAEGGARSKRPMSQKRG